MLLAADLENVRFEQIAVELKRRQVRAQADEAFV